MGSHPISLDGYPSNKIFTLWCMYISEELLFVVRVFLYFFRSASSGRKKRIGHLLLTLEKGKIDHTFSQMQCLYNYYN